MDLYGGPDSQINTQPVNFSAYSHRDSLWVFQLYARTNNGNLPFDNNIIPFITDFTSSLTTAQPNGSFAAYLNYLDPSLSPRRPTTCTMARRRTSVSCRSKSCGSEYDILESAGHRGLNVRLDVRQLSAVQR